MNKVEIVCRALVINNQNQVLFVKKTDSDFWSLPGGKLDEEDESLQKCLVRELQEEIGVEVVVRNIRFVQELHKNNIRYIELIWDATLSNDPINNISEDILKTSNGELADIQWIKKDDLPKTNIKPEFLKKIDTEVDILIYE